MVLLLGAWLSERNQEEEGHIYIIGVSRQLVRGQ